MKYIVFDNSVSGEEMIVFSDCLQHVDIANKFNWPVISAGTIMFYEDGSFDCYGESSSLKAVSRKGVDVDLMKRRMKFRC